MGLRIQTNIASLNAQRNLAVTSYRLGRTMEKLSSGFRIVRAADDAAGMAIAQGLRADIRSLEQARRNANDAVSMVQVAEGGLEEITNIMVRLRELSIQAASDTIGSSERDFLNREFMALKDEIDRIAMSTEFNGTRLLTGNKELEPELLVGHNRSPLEIQVGKDYFLGADSLENPNPTNIIRMDFDRMNATTDGEGSLEIGSAQNEAGTNLLTKFDAQRSISRLDDAMQKVNSYRASLGALQNRFVSTDRNLGVAIENLGAARSRIQDADFASETAEYTQLNILQQAGVSVLAQANQVPNIALQLLQQ